jgi:hypothetical protein
MNKNTVVVDSSRFKDEYGRTLILRGVNLGGNCKTPSWPEAAVPGGSAFFDHHSVSFVGRPFPLAEADEHFSRLSAWGFNFVRFLVTWEAIEHAGPGQYDHEYLDYISAIVRKAGEFGLSLFIDFHQDVWSRFSGGDGAPGWTFDAIGMDIARFEETGAAVLHRPDSAQAPGMIWPTNAGKLAAATMFTLFFGGHDFAPRTFVDGEPVREYLQRHYFGAVGQVALRLKHESHVIGYDTMNEPQAGFIGRQDLLSAGGVLKLGGSPSPFQAMLLGAGYPQAVDVWERRVTGPRRIGRRTQNPDGRRVWREGFECVWKQNGVWDVAEDGAPRLLCPDYFYRVNGRPVDFSRDYYYPFAVKFARAVRAVDPETAVFIEPEVPLPPPPWKAEDAINLVYAPHWYDGPVLFLKHFNRFLGFDPREERVILGPGAIRRSYAGQLMRYKRESGERLHNAPVVLGEFGIPFDLDGKKAYRTHDWRTTIMAMDRSFRAVEDALMHCALWNYASDNSNEYGDGWNGEDLSIWSRDQQTDPADINSGGRALEAVLRPYARAIAGEPLSMAFDIRRGEFVFAFRHDPAVLAPTEFYIPNYQYPDGYAVEVSDGTFEIDREKQTLVYRHTAERTVHTIRVRK